MKLFSVFCYYQQKKKQKIWWIKKNNVLLHPQTKMTASVAQLVRAPDC